MNFKRHLSSASCNRVSLASYSTLDKHPVHVLSKFLSNLMLSSQKRVSLDFNRESTGLFNARMT